MCRHCQAHFCMTGKPLSNGSGALTGVHRTAVPAARPGHGIVAGLRILHCLRALRRLRYRGRQQQGHGGAGMRAALRLRRKSLSHFLEQPTAPQENGRAPKWSALPAITTGNASFKCLSKFVFLRFSMVSTASVFFAPKRAKSLENIGFSIPLRSHRVHGIPHHKTDYGPEGRGFESLTACHERNLFCLPRQERFPSCFQGQYSSKYR